MAENSWEDFFAKRRWRVAAEVTGSTVAEPGTRLNIDGDKPVMVRFEKGRFEIDGGVFHSPLSSARGKKGILLQEVDTDGHDIVASRIAVGVVVYRRAKNEGAVVS